jgi:hypothetical protein
MVEIWDLDQSSFGEDFSFRISLATRFGEPRNSLPLKTRHIILEQVMSYVVDSVKVGPSDKGGKIKKLS